MASSEGTVEKPCVITQGLPSYTETVSPPVSNKINTKRWLIVAITAVVIVAMVTGATLFGVYMQNSHVRSLVQEVTVNTKDGKERIRADPEKGEEEYDLPDKKFRVLHDFNKGISVFRTEFDEKFGCFLLPLNRTAMMNPEALASYLKKGGDLDIGDKQEDKETHKYDLVVSESKVKDTSFLSDSARDMCDGLSVYWLLPGGPDSPAEGEKKGHRQKRACYYRYYCYTRCYWYYYNGWRYRCIRYCGWRFFCTG